VQNEPKKISFFRGLDFLRIFSASTARTFDVDAISDRKATSNWTANIMRDHLSPREQRESLGAGMMLPLAADRDEWFVPASRWRFQNAQADPDNRDSVRDGNALLR